MSSWVTSRQSLGPICCPISALSSSMPFTVGGVLMAESLSAVVPGPRLQGVAERLAATAEDRLPVRHERVVEVEVEQRLEGRGEPLAVEALDLGVDLVRGPDDQLPPPLRHGIAEDERPVARKA